jgi:cytosine/adenosine deaminase-related metal-dependent hydrolase
MLRYRAAWVLPIGLPPIRGGVVSIERDVITSVAPYEGGEVEDLGSVAILPGLVNAHTHLELSWMRGQVPPDRSMPAWAQRLIGVRRGLAGAPDPAEPIVEALRQARAAGSCLVGDVTNSLAAYEPLIDSELSAAVFAELIGFSAQEPEAIVKGAIGKFDELTPIEWLRLSLAAHAPYSVSPALLQAIGRGTPHRPLSVHLGESAQEIEFLREGTGEWRALLEAVGAWNPLWTPPACGPVEYLDRLGLVSGRLLAVHGVHLTDGELSRLAAAGATIVTCPRSNHWTGAGVPPVDRFYASGVRVAIGTDSLASVEDLNLFAEMAEVRRLAPGVPPARILESATLSGAQALGFADELGSLHPGKRAQLLAVRLPTNCSDVEEYLLSGIQPSDVSWLNPEPRTPNQRT